MQVRDLVERRGIGAFVAGWPRAGPAGCGVASTGSITARPNTASSAVAEVVEVCLQPVRRHAPVRVGAQQRKPWTGKRSACAMARRRAAPADACPGGNRCSMTTNGASSGPRVGDHVQRGIVGVVDQQHEPGGRAIVPGERRRQSAIRSASSRTGTATTAVAPKNTVVGMHTSGTEASGSGVGSGLRQARVRSALRRRTSRS